MSALLGLNAKAYRLTTGTRATWGAADANGINGGAAPANLDPMDQVKDVTINIESGDADVSTRGNNGWKANLQTLNDASVEISMVYDPADADYIALLGAFLKKTSIALALLDADKATSGTQGLWADFMVTSIKKGEPLEEAQMVDITVKPALSSVAPQWVKVP